MPRNNKDKTKNIEKTVITTSNMISKFKLYKNSTGQVPEIVIDLTDSAQYHEGILYLFDILSTYRDKDTVIQFKVLSAVLGSSEENLSTFIIKCSDLYIIGYKIGEEFRVFRDTGKPGFPSLKYLNDNNEFKWSYIDIQTERNNKAIQENWETIHTLAHVIAEAIRDEKIEERIIELMCNGYQKGNRDHKIFGDISSEVSVTSSEEHQDIVSSIDIIHKVTVKNFENKWKEQTPQKKIISAGETLEDNLRLLIAGPFWLTIIAQLNGCSVEELTSGNFQHQDQNKVEESELDERNTEEVNDVNDLEGEGYIDIDESIFNRLLRELMEENISHEYNLIYATRLLAPKILPIYEVISPHIETTINVLGYKGSRIPALNSSQVREIEEGKYRETSPGSGKYEKIPGSERFTYTANNNNDYRPDEDQDGNAIIVGGYKTDIQEYPELYFKISSYLSWLQNLPEWLQRETLKSKVAQNIIDSLKSTIAIYQPKSVTEEFNVKLNQVLLEENFQEGTDDNSLKAQVLSREDIHDLIDMTIVVTASVMSIPLLLTIESIMPSIDPISLLGKINPLGDFTNYDLLNVLEVSY